jgi:hypothetical protein
VSWVARGCAKVCDASLVAVGAGCPQLRHLDLWLCDRISDTGTPEARALITEHVGSPRGPRTQAACFSLYYVFAAVVIKYDRSDGLSSSLTSRLTA